MLNLMHPRHSTRWICPSQALGPLRLTPRFSKLASELRHTYESVFQNPLQANSRRFCWDYWNVPGQYRLLRTPAENFFGPLGQKWIRELTTWGRNTLGCQMVSHPWMSVYLDGHFQALHSDVPHGPWSFVYSLTPTPRFSGGHTLMARPKLVQYFEHLNYSHSDETSDLFHRVAPHFNQLAVFDPRYPHGVETVEGVHDLLQGRVVIHGWFTEPRPMLEGALSTQKASKPMDQLAQGWIEGVQNLSPQVTGLLTLRFEIAPSGNIQSTQVLCGHLLRSNGTSVSQSELKQIHTHLAPEFQNAFPMSRGKTTLTLPIEFRT